MTKTGSAYLGARVIDGYALCPACWKKLCCLEPGGSARGVLLWCRGCKKQVLLETE